MNIAYCNLKSWFKYALEIIQNDTDIAYELQNFPIENRLKSSEWETPCKEVLGAFLTDVLLNFEHYDINCMGAADCRWKLWSKNHPKLGFAEVKTDADFSNKIDIKYHVYGVYWLDQKRLIKGHYHPVTIQLIEI